MISPLKKCFNECTPGANRDAWKLQAPLPGMVMAEGKLWTTPSYRDWLAEARARDYETVTDMLLGMFIVDGHTPDMMARELKVSTQTIYNLMCVLGIRNLPAGGPNNPAGRPRAIGVFSSHKELCQRVTRMYESGHTHVDIMATCGISRQTFDRIRVEKGLTNKRYGKKKKRGGG